MRSPGDGDLSTGINRVRVESIPLNFASGEIGAYAVARRPARRLGRPYARPMDRAALADELRRARCRPTQFREGYAERDVDDLIDAVVRQLLSPEADSRTDADIVAMVDAARFPVTTMRRGYAQGDVDAILSHLVASLGGTWTPRSSAGASEGA